MPRLKRIRKRKQQFDDMVRWDSDPDDKDNGMIVLDDEDLPKVVERKPQKPYKPPGQK